MNEYVAHISEDGSVQTLEDHLKGVARLASEFASKFGEKELGYFMGALHDIGKYSDEFQDYIRKAVANPESSFPKVDHSSAGAYEAYKLFNKMLNAMPGSAAPIFIELCSACIAGHHSGLLNFGSDKNANPFDGTYFGRIESGKQNKLPDYSKNWHSEIVEPKVNFNGSIVQNLWMDIFVFSKVLYSCLVDADFCDTADFMDSNRIRKSCNTISELLEIANTYVARFGNPMNQLNKARTDIMNCCVNAGGKDKGIYTFTAPTGGGKTISSLLVWLVLVVALVWDSIMKIVSKNLQNILYSTMTDLN